MMVHRRRPLTIAPLAGGDPSTLVAPEVSDESIIRMTESLDTNTDLFGT
jgi:hypothetical protein